MGLGARIASVSMALPERLVSNEQIAADLDVDAAWIAKRTGTRERPWATGDERLSELAADAGRVPHPAATGLAHIKQPNYRRQPRT